MRLFLSSYRFGAHYDRLLELVGAPGRVAVIANACDAWPSAWASAVTSDLVPLRRSGFEPAVVDLRDYVGRAGDLEETLAGFPMVWVRGGNTFVLRAQFARSGADLALRRLLDADALVYAGYSAGACVMTPDLRGLEAMDDPDEVRTACGGDVLWDGLGLVDHRIVPHLDSPTDPEGLSRKLSQEYRIGGIAHWALTDDDAVIVDGERLEVLGAV
ncbi:Type 1 glutamine amidotransferase-like domain-containing protein [Nocardia otitidiscaviarum]|uniref:Type 1 glutamine amidotransferase-like domain-containing protein n=1 Tax=Nocardia otitidiscaviarum TaxID=1823 RepID=UPI001895FCD8|nr:Type 1 glutamine amidotransferase-like domain-containing protein [Nocardia otitidiscaviarum]MBF6235535.1 Type 1 glutamine amidotransferase-like domain-containing protein [Nocardia otitidiscaviarum]